LASPDALACEATTGFVAAARPVVGIFIKARSALASTLQEPEIIRVIE
jgi:hypothetical protein